MGNIEIALKSLVHARLKLLLQLRVSQTLRGVFRHHQERLLTDLFDCLPVFASQQCVMTETAEDSGKSGFGGTGY